MRHIVKMTLLLGLSLAPAGCGGGTAAVTDPNQLPPLTAEEIQQARSEDDQVASEEHRNPVQAKRGGARGK